MTPLTDATFNRFLQYARPVVIKFGAPWCGPCQQLERFLADIEKSFPSVHFGEVNTDQNRGVTQKYRITNIPATILFSEGREVQRIVGCQPQLILEMIERAR